MKMRGDVIGSVVSEENLLLTLVVQCTYARSYYSLTAISLFILYTEKLLC